jgi:hypothetical protein
MKRPNKQSAATATLVQLVVVVVVLLKKRISTYHLQKMPRKLHEHCDSYKNIAARTTKKTDSWSSYVYYHRSILDDGDGDDDQYSLTSLVSIIVMLQQGAFTLHTHGMTQDENGTLVTACNSKIVIDKRCAEPSAGTTTEFL